MPEEQPKSSLKITIPLLAVVIIGAAFFYVVKLNNRVGEEAVAVPQPTPEVTTQEEPAIVPVETPTPAPTVDPLDPTVEEKIQAIAAEVDAGTLTREEAQAKVNKILGIE